MRALCLPERLSGVPCGLPERLSGVPCARERDVLTDTQVAASPTTTALAPGWRMWVPCLGMALCSWLSFVDRQVLAILSPTILSGHRADQPELHRRGLVLLSRLHPRQSGLGIGPRLRRPARRHAAGGRRLDGRQHVARVDGAPSSASRSRAPCSDSARARRFLAGCGRPSNHCPRIMRARGIALSFSGGTIGAVMMPLLLGPLAIRYGWRTAFLATGAFGLLWLADLGRHRAAAVPAEGRAPAGEDDVAEFLPSAASGRSSSATRCRPFPRDRS